MLCLQWGVIAKQEQAKEVTITYPVTFSAKPVVVKNYGLNKEGSFGEYRFLSFYDIQKNSAKTWVAYDPTDVMWFAIGY